MEHITPKSPHIILLATDTSDAEAMLPWKDAFEKYSDKKLPKSMTLNQWLNMWGRLCYGSAGIADFPIWVQILPEIFFKVMDKSHNGILTCDDIKNFYKGLIGIKDPAKLEKTSKEGFRAMTAVSCYLKSSYYIKATRIITETSVLVTYFHTLFIAEW